MSDFRFDHKKYKSRKITIERLDKVFDSFIEPSTGTFSSFVAGLKIIVFFTYLWARKRMIDEEMFIAKQDYEQGRTNSNSSDINQDDLD